MASFPSSIIGTAGLPVVSGGNSTNNPPHHTQHNTANGEVIAIETTLGINPQGTYATVAAALTTHGTLITAAQTTATTALTTATAAQTTANAAIPKAAFTGGKGLILAGNSTGAGVYAAIASSGTNGYAIVAQSTATGGIIWGPLYPAAGVPVSTGATATAWGSSITVGTGNNNLLQLNGSAQIPAVSGALLKLIPLVSQVAQPYVKVSETETSGTAGGEAVINTWTTRVLNTKDSDTASIASLASNQVTLPAGTYTTHVKSFFQNTSVTQLRLQNITGSATLLTGLNIDPQSGNAGNSGMIATMDGLFTLSGSSALAVQYQCASMSTGDDLGRAGSYGVEVYTVAEFTKIG